MPHLRPKISIGNGVYLPKIRDDGPSIREYLSQFRKNIVEFKNGRSALLAAMKNLELKSDDEILISTTSGGRYVSSCVTQQIDMICRYTFSMSKKTRAVLIIHEFGYLNQSVEKLRKSGLPIIEDCAYAFGALCKGYGHAAVGDYVIISLSKFLPFLGGGALLSDHEIRTPGGAGDQFIQSSINLDQLEIWRDRCTENNRFLASNLTFKPQEYFAEENGVPEVFCFRTDVEESILAGLQSTLSTYGIESAPFWRNNGYFIPNAHAMSERQLEYLTESVNRAWQQNVGEMI